MAKEAKVVPLRRTRGRPRTREGQRTLYVRMPQDILDELERRAGASLRSITAEIEYSLRAYFKKGK